MLRGEEKETQTLGDLTTTTTTTTTKSGLGKNFFFKFLLPMFSLGLLPGFTPAVVLVRLSVECVS